MARCDVIVIGGGLAGLNAALIAAEHGSVAVISKTPLDGTNTSRAQGGIAAAVGADDDPERHAADTIRAGAGLCDPAAVGVLTREGPGAVRRLIELGVGFDRGGDGRVALGREGAHSVDRVLHAGGDRTGLHVQSALAARAEEAGLDLRIGARARELIIDGGRCVGAVVEDADGNAAAIEARAVILATGGAGALYRHTTNPPGATADGLGLALRAGAIVRDVEFVQFHPTALVAADGSAFLVSEALRGEGAILRNAAGDRFMAGIHPDAELAPRSVVANAIVETMRRDGTDRVWLDISHRGADFIRERFPGVHAGCLERGRDLAAGPVPVAPAAHYHMGGVAADLEGRTSVPGLYACGESAATGAHGANRVASNSLLEAAVFSAHAARAALERPRPAEFGTAPEPLAIPASAAAPSWDALRAAMSAGAGLVRSAEGLAAAASKLDACSSIASGAHAETRLAALAARAIIAAALAREETRGAHVRSDFPAPDSRQASSRFRRMAIE